MSCLFPGAPNLASFWSNIVRGVDAIRDTTKAEWDPERFYETGQTDDFEKIYCKRGGFVTELADFDPLKYGVMPNSIKGSDPDQLLALKVASEALADAGYSTKPFNRERAEVILGRTSAPGGGAMNLIQQGQTVGQMIRVISSLNPHYTREQLEGIAEQLRMSLARCSSDNIPAVMPNIMAGRIAGRLGFNGRSLLLDSACASSLIAVETAIRDLMSDQCDLALAGGIHINAFACFYQIFCGLGALSRSEQIRPFDALADGTLLGEGLGVVALKRYDDALKDGDRIYAVIRGIGSSSDGQGTAMLAPSAEGEAIALRRAYDMAGVPPQTVSLLEAHGTGTPSGDVVEMQAVEKVFGKTTEPYCALGSVKSMIGHCQAASGIAGLIKAALSLYHKILPPTLHVTTPNPQIDWKNSPCYINTKARTWIHPQTHPRIPQDLAQSLNLPKTEPRRAAVSAFGFGGVNAHAVLEEHRDELEVERATLLQEWDTELCLLYAESQERLLTLLSDLESFLRREPNCKIRDVAYTLSKECCNEEHKERIAFVARSPQDLIEKIGYARLLIKEGSDKSGAAPQGVYFAQGKKVRQGKLAFILPGLGAAYPNMLAELCLHFPDVRAVFDFVDELSLGSQGQRLPSKRIFPAPHVNESASSLASMDSAVVTVLMAEWALFTLLSYLGINPDTFIGCSTGEFAALTMCGAIDLLEAAPLFYDLSTHVASSIPQESMADLRSVKVDADYDECQKHFTGLKEVYLGADLSPRQFIVSGFKETMTTLCQRLKEASVPYTPLPTAIPYHTPLVKDRVDPNQQDVKLLNFTTPMIDSWSCSRAGLIPDEPDDLRALSTDLFTHPILLKETIRSAYKAGFTKFVEVGPKGTLTPVIAEILHDSAHLAVAANTSVGSALTQLQNMLAALASNDVELQLDYLFTRRAPAQLDIFTAAEKPKKPSSTVRLSLAYPEIVLSKEQSEYLNENFHLRTPGSIADDGHDEAIHATESESAQEADLETTVLNNYMEGLTAFHQNLMSMQADVMRSYLAASISVSQEEEMSDLAIALMEETNAVDPAIGASLAAVDALFDLPLLRSGQVEAYSPERGEISIALNLTLKEHQYLLDHAIGDAVATAPGAVARVYLMPLTVALETMAEAASLLVPGKAVVKISSVRAVKRIRVDHAGLPVRVTAQYLGGDCVKAEILMARNGSLESAMSCQVHFLDQYPAYPQDAGANFDQDTTRRSPKIAPDQLYDRQFMFHGPRMQSVRTLELVAQKQIKAVVEARPAYNWFPALTEPKFLIDPLLLDNCTQPVLFHLFEHDENVTALLPFLIDSVEVYCQLSRLNGLLQVTAQLISLTSRGTEADVQLRAHDGSILARFTAISSRRIALNQEWKTFVAAPQQTMLAEPLAAAEIASPSQSIACSVIGQNMMPDDESTLAWCTDYILTSAEQESYQALPNAARKKEWLLGRIAAKDAVRRLLGREAGLSLAPADVEITTLSDGRPIASGFWQSELAWQPLISISHKDGIATAAAARNSNTESNIGIDIETIAEKEEGFEKLALNEGERQLLGGAKAAKRDLQLTRIWSAKEAVGKALTSGLSNNPRSLEVISLDESKNDECLCVVKAQDRTCYSVRCVKLDNYVVALTLLEKV